MERLARVAIVGVGHARVYRRDDQRLAHLAVDAVTRAIDDAGLTSLDIDGVSTTPYQPFDGAGDSDGIEIVSPEFLREAMRLDLAWADRQIRPVGASLIATLHAVASGQCKYATCFRALHSPAGRRYGLTNPTTVTGGAQFRGPYGVFPPAIYALNAQEYMEKYGTTREQLGAFVVRNRRQALKWEYGYWYQKGEDPFTLDDYMSSRMISSPLCILDCDIPVQTAAAFVVTTAERAKDLRNPPVYVLGTSNPFSAPTRAITSLEQYMADGQENARHLWKNSGVGPKDVNIANLYDGFSIFTPLWAEALGLCSEGEGFAFAASPPLPLNTSSGSLGAGRTHGIGQIMDSVLQIQGRSGPRQVEKVDICLAVTNPCTIGTGFVFSKAPS